MKAYNSLELDALDFLRQNDTGVIATCFEGVPHATTVYYIVDDDFNFFFLTKTNTQKNIHTAFNLNVAIAVGTGPQKITVQVRGTAQILVGDEKLDIAARMIAHFSNKSIMHLPIQAMSHLKNEHFVAYKVIPEELLFMNMNETSYPKSVSMTYHKII